jgi:hypothetical protein
LHGKKSKFNAHLIVKKVINLEINHAPKTEFCKNKAGKTYSVEHFQQHDLGRCHVEAFIKKVFSSHYKANITHFAPDLLANYDKEGHIASAVGISALDKAKSYVEQYLDDPIESLLQKKWLLPLKEIPLWKLVI